MDGTVATGPIAPQSPAAQGLNLTADRIQRRPGFETQKTERRQSRGLGSGHRRGQDEQQEKRPADHGRSIAFHCGEF
jgi:hypothetical protein